MRQGSPSIVRLLLSDGQLARLAASGDGRAFDAIFRRHQQDLYRFCLAMTGDPQDAQAATQSTMARVRRALPEKDRRTELKPWLYRLARDEVAAVQRAVQAETPPQSAESRAEARRLLGDLERLPSGQRAVLVMRELSGLGFTEIGAAFETTPAAVRETLYEARLGMQEVERSREARCQETMRYLSNADGRAPWRPRHHLHLRECPDCRAFRDEIAARRSGLTALTSLPLAASATALAKLTATATATVAVVAGVTAVERGGPFGSGPEREAPATSQATSPKHAQSGRAPAAERLLASQPAGAAAAPAGGKAVETRLGSGLVRTAPVASTRPQPAHPTGGDAAHEVEVEEPAIDTPPVELARPEPAAGEAEGAVPPAEVVPEVEPEDGVRDAIESVAELSGESGVQLPAPGAAVEPPGARPGSEHRRREPGPDRGRHGGPGRR